MPTVGEGTKGEQAEVDGHEFRGETGEGAFFEEGEIKQGKEGEFR